VCRAFLFSQQRLYGLPQGEEAVRKQLEGRSKLS
jgi:hypothetical protein